MVPICVHFRRLKECRLLVGVSVGGGKVVGSGDIWCGGGCMVLICVISFRRLQV